MATDTNAAGLPGWMGLGVSVLVVGECRRFVSFGGGVFCRSRFCDLPLDASRVVDGFWMRDLL